MEHEVTEVRIPVSITLPKDLVEWLDKQVEGRLYYNRSHAIEGIVRKEMKKGSI